MAIERIISVGISVRRGNAEMLARFTLSKDEQEQRLPEIARELGVEEIVYMATCNRVEVVCLVPMNVSTAHFRPRIYKILSGDDPQPGKLSVYGGPGLARARSNICSWSARGSIQRRSVNTRSADRCVKPSRPLARPVPVGGC